MLIKLSGAKVYDPANSVNGELRDVYVDGGKIVSPDSGARVGSIGEDSIA